LHFRPPSVRRGETLEAATLRQILEDVYGNILCHIPPPLKLPPERACIFLPPDRLLYRGMSIIDGAENIRTSVGDSLGMFPTSRPLRGAGTLVVGTIDC
jgi:hypothetical protein